MQKKGTTDLCPVHTAPFLTKTKKKIPVFVKPFTLLRTKRHKNGGFQKRSTKWIFTETEVFENAVGQCERTKTDKNKNAATATTKYFTLFSPQYFTHSEFEQNKEL